MIRIAVCDDDELYITKTIKPLLMKAQKVVGIQIDVKFFSNGVRLLEEYNNHQYYDIVILDIDMPDINGKELAARLRESGMHVVGMGEKKTPNPFIAACNRFVYLENLAQGEVSDTAEQDKDKSDDEVHEVVKAKTIKNAICSIIGEVSDDDGWASLSEVGNILLKRYPSFDVRNFGFQKLTPFIKSLGKFEIYSIPSEKGNVKVMYVRVK